MKRIVAVLLCGALMSSMVFSGCSKTAETTVTEETTTTSQTEETSAPAETEPAVTAPARLEINMDNLLKVSEYYSSKNPDGSFAFFYVDGIRGNGSYKVSTDEIILDYTGLDNTCQMQINVDRESRMMRVYFDLFYGKTRLYGSGETGIWDMQSFIDEILANAGTYELYDDSALKKNPDAVQKDLPILYARFIRMADMAFPELGIKFEDLGLDLGKKYRDIDPTQNLSSEKSVKNSHKYKNGVCTDCKKLWTEYYYSAIGVVANQKKGWHSVYGQKSATMLSPEDYVQMSASNKKSGEVAYVHLGDSKHDIFEMCTVSANKSKKTLKTSIRFDYEQKSMSIGKGTVCYKYCYYITVSAKPGQYNKVFASKEAFKKNAKVELYIFNKKGVGKKTSISKAKKKFAKDKCTYYTKAQILEKAWEQHEAIFSSMDSGMTLLDTNLADIGINWK